MQTPRETSPFALIQEELRDRPWRLLVACVMLNQTSIKQVRPVIWKVFERWPTDVELAQADPEELAECIKTLGFQNRRARSLIRMSSEYVNGFDWDDVTELHGIGEYAADSWRIFVLEDCPGSEGEVDDEKLKKYVGWAVGRVSSVRGEHDQQGVRQDVPDGVSSPETPVPSS